MPYLLLAACIMHVSGFDIHTHARLSVRRLHDDRIIVWATARGASGLASSRRVADAPARASKKNQTSRWRFETPLDRGTGTPPEAVR